MAFEEVVEKLEDCRTSIRSTSIAWNALALSMLEVPKCLREVFVLIDF